MRRDSRQGKDVFNVVTTCVQSVVTTLKTSFPCLQSLLIKRGSLVCVNITKITLQMRLDTSCNNIKDVLSLPRVSPHQTWAWKVRL
jgi:hypothetical protein